MTTAKKRTPRDATAPAPAETRAGLTIERYGEVLAHRRHFPEARRTEVLLRLGIRPERWAAAQRAWGTAITDELGRDETELLTRFVRALGQTGRRLMEFPPYLEDLGAPIDPNAPDAEELAARMRTSLASPGAESELPRPSFAVAQVAASGPSPWAAHAHPAPTPSTPPASASSPSVEAPAWMPKGMLGLTDVGGTVAAPVGPSAPALPFEATPPSVSSPPQAPLPPPLPPGRPPTRAPGSALPTRMIPALSLEQYASLCVDLEADPGRRSETLRRYQIAEEHHASLEAHWQARMTAEPTLAAAFQSARAAYRAWLAQSSSRPR